MATEATEGAHGAAEATAAVGMPQLDFSTFPNQIFWLVVTLVVIYLILSRVALPRIASVLTDRQGTIANDIAAAEELKLKAQEAEKAYEQALADARAEASRIAAETRAEIAAQLDEAKAKADAEIAARVAESQKRIEEIRAGAADAVAEVARDTASELVALLTPGKGDAQAVSAAVAARLKG
jgi:F-type H+-transporting ATPase subunit b